MDVRNPTARAPYADVRRIGIPRGLLYYRYAALWRTFFEELGREVMVDTPSDRGVFERGQKLSVDECCLASKLFMGHAAALAHRCDALFVPSMDNLGRHRGFCTKFQALPDLTRNAFGGACPRIISLSVEEQEGGNDEREAFLRLAADLGATHREAKAAYRAARKAQDHYDAALAKAQSKLVATIEKLPAAERPLTILFAAHPYVSHDPFVGGPVADALREMGATVLYADEFDRERALKRSFEFSATMPWIVNRELVGAILELHEHVDGIVLASAFPCGPDSMTNDAINRCVKGKPILTLTVDAQSGTAGLETRIESFVDILTYQKRGGYFHE